MAHYVDGFVIPLPKNKIDQDRRIAEKSGEVWRDHGALEYREWVGEDLNVKCLALDRSPGAAARAPFPRCRGSLAKRSHRTKHASPSAPAPAV